MNGIERMIEVYHAEQAKTFEQWLGDKIEDTCPGQFFEIEDTPEDCDPDNQERCKKCWEHHLRKEMK